MSNTKIIKVTEDCTITLETLAVRMIDDPAFASALAERRDAIVAERRAVLLAELEKLGGVPMAPKATRARPVPVDTSVTPELVETAFKALVEAGEEGIAARTIGTSIGRILVAQGRAYSTGTAGATRYYYAAHDPRVAAE